jgi:hypothetical protein
VSVETEFKYSHFRNEVIKCLFMNSIMTAFVSLLTLLDR